MLLGCMYELVLHAVGNWVAVQIITGRTHQIRIHLSESKHPVLGDTLYGSPRLKERAPRLALHAYSLSFEHPRTGEKHLLRIPLADDLEKLRRTLAHDFNK